MAKGVPDVKELAKSFNVHGDARRLVMAAMIAAKFEFIQAPNEADPQLVQCWMDNHKSAIVTIDSDLCYFWNPGMKIIYWGHQHLGLDFINPNNWWYYAPSDPPIPSSVRNKSIQWDDNNVIAASTWWDMTHGGKQPENLLLLMASVGTDNHPKLTGLGFLRVRAVLVDESKTYVQTRNALLAKCTDYLPLLFSFSRRLLVPVWQRRPPRPLLLLGRGAGCLA